MKKKTGFIGIGILILINVLLFNIILNKKLDLIDMPIAKVKIDTRTKIEEDMIDIVKIPRVLLNEDCMTDKQEIINKYTEIEGIIPQGSMFYRSMLFDENELPDFPALKLKEGQNVFSLPTDLVKSSGNSLTNNQRIDLHVTLSFKKEDPVTDCLLKNVRILNVFDRKGIDMKESESKIPSVINLAIDTELVPLLRKASEMGTIDLYATVFNEEEECILNEESVILPFLNE